MKKLLLSLLLGFSVSAAWADVDTKISAMSSTTTLNSVDIIPVVTNPASAPANFVISAQDLTTTLNILTTSSATATYMNRNLFPVSLSTSVMSNLPVTRLNSGTNADSSHFWRGDAVWISSSSFTDTPGGNTTQVQYNNGGAFGGSGNLIVTSSLTATTAVALSSAVAVKEGGTQTPISGNDVIWGDSTAHWLKMNPNASQDYLVVGSSTTNSAGQCVSWAGGNSLTNTGAACGSGSGSSSDFLSVLVNATKTVGATVTLTASDYDEVIIATNSTSANLFYKITLPAPVSNKFIYIEISTFTTSLVYISQNSADQIDGATKRVMWAGETAMLRSDGANWHKVAGKTIPMFASMYNALCTNANNTTTTKVLIDTTLSDTTGKMADTTNNQIIARRAGTHSIFATTVWDGSGCNTAGTGLSANSARTITAVNNNGSQIRSAEGYGVATGFPGYVVAHMVSLSEGDKLTLNGYQTSGATQGMLGASFDGAGVAQSQMAVLEVPTW